MKNRFLLIVTYFILLHFCSFATSYTSAGTGAWNTATTWSPNGIPGKNDDATILIGHNVTTSSSPQSQINNLTINLGGTLTMGSGASLSAFRLLTNNGTFAGTGNLGLRRSDGGIVISGTGTWSHTGDIYFNNTASTTQIIDANVIINKSGKIYLDNTAGNNGNEWVTNNGSVTLSNGTINLRAATNPARWTQGAGSTLSIFSGLVAAATFTFDASAANNKVIYTGVNYTIKQPSLSQYYNLTVVSGTKTFGFNLIVNDLTVVNAGAVLNRSASQNITISGNWAANGTILSGVPSGGTVTFNGSGAQTIGGAASTQQFPNLTITSTSTVTLLRNAQVNNDLNVSSGTFDLGTFTCNRGSAGGTLTVSNSATLKIGGTNTFPANYTTNTLGVSSTVEYNGSGVQIVGARNYGNLTINNASGVSSSGAVIISGTTTALTSGIYTANSSLTFNGAAAQSITGGAGSIVSTGGLTINNAAGVTSSQAISISGTTTTLTAGTLTANSSLTLNGGVAQSITGGTGNIVSTGGLTISNAAGVTSSQAISISGTTTTLTAGSLTANSSLTFNGGAAQSITGGAGSIVSTGGLTINNAAGVTSSQAISISGVTTTLTAGTLTTNSSLTFNGGAAQSITGGTGDIVSTGGLTINNAAGVTSSQAISISGNTTMTSGTLTANSSLTFNGGVAQTISGGTGDIVSTGGLTINNAAGVTNNVPVSVTSSHTLTAGVFTNNSTLTYNGAAAQTISGAGSITCSSIGTITINNAAGVTTSSPMAVAGVIRATAGTFATGATAITVTSVAGNTGRIGDCTGGNITGTAWTMQRYIASADTGWQDISSPITGANISQWDATLKMSIASGCPDGLAAGWHSVYYWNVAGAGSWTTVTNCIEPLSVGRGFEIWLASTTTTFVPTGTTSTMGTPTVGTKAVTIGNANGEFALLGNPYQSPLDWTTMRDNDNTNVKDYFSIFDETTHTYESWDCTSGPCSATGGKLAASSGTIPAYQGFWVENLTAVSSFTFKENHKIASTFELAKQQNTFETNLLRMKIYSKSIPNVHNSIIRFKEGASEYDDGFGDIAFRPSREKESPSLVSVSADNHKLSVSTYPDDKEPLDIPLIANVGLAGDYFIDFKGINTLFGYNCISLEDKETGLTIPLTSDKTYSFSQSDISKERLFVLHLANICNAQTPFANTVRVYSVNDGVALNFNFEELTNVQVSVYNILGENISSQNIRAEKEVITIPLSGANQMYFVKVTTSGGTTTYKIFH